MSNAQHPSIEFSATWCLLDPLKLSNAGRCLMTKWLFRQVVGEVERAGGNVQVDIRTDLKMARVITDAMDVTIQKAIGLHPSLMTMTQIKVGSTKRGGSRKVDCSLAFLLRATLIGDLDHIRRAALEV